MSKFFTNFSVFKFRVRAFPSALLFLFSCLITFLFLMAKPSLANVPAWGFTQYGVYDSSSSCTSQVQTQFDNKIAGSPGFTGVQTKGNVVYAISDQNMIINFCVHQSGEKALVVSFVTGYDRSQTDRIVKYIDAVRPHFVNY